MPWDEQFCCCSLVGKMRRVLETMSLQNRFLRQCKNKHKKIRHTPRKSLGVPGKKTNNSAKRQYAVDHEICRVTSWYFCNSQKSEILSLLERWQLRIILKILNLESPGGRWSFIFMMVGWYHRVVSISRYCFWKYIHFDFHYAYYTVY